MVHLALDETWLAALHLKAKDGQPVVEEVEVHVRPADRHRDLDPEAGVIRVPQVPEGGLPLRLLKTLRFGEALDFARDALKEVAKDDPAALGWHGFTRATLDAPRRIGRNRRPDRYYAEIAAGYVEALEQGSRRPVVDVAERMSAEAREPFTPENVRDALHHARRRGVLTKPPRGVAGGALTDRGRVALAEAP